MELLLTEQLKNQEEQPGGGRGQRLVWDMLIFGYLISVQGEMSRRLSNVCVQTCTEKAGLEIKTWEVIGKQMVFKRGM